MLLSYIGHEDLKRVSFDVCVAFPYGELKEPIHMEVPKGVSVKKEDGESVACVLKKSLYGSKLAPECWNMNSKVFCASLIIRNKRQLRVFAWVILKATKHTWPYL